MSVRSVYLVVSGHVQGVGFRYFALHKALEFQIAGWVCNAPDGKVEIEAEGKDRDIETFIDWMKIGPSRAMIRSFSVSEISPPRNFTDFTIR